MYDNIEVLRQELLDEAYAGAFAGFGAMILEVDEIYRANTDELEAIAQRYKR